MRYIKICQFISNITFLVILTLFAKIAIASTNYCDIPENCSKGCAISSFTEVTLTSFAGTNSKLNNPSCLAFLASPYNKIYLPFFTSKLIPWFKPETAEEDKNSYNFAAMTLNAGSTDSIPFITALGSNDVYNTLFSNKQVQVFKNQNASSFSGVNNNFIDAFCNMYAFGQYYDSLGENYSENSLQSYIKQKLGIETNGNNINIHQGDYFKGYIAITNSNSDKFIPNFNIEASNKTSLPYNLIYFNCNHGNNVCDYPKLTINNHKNFNSLNSSMFKNTTDAIIFQAIVGTDSPYYFKEEPSLNCSNLTANTGSVAIFNNYSNSKTAKNYSCNSTPFNIYQYVTVMCVEPQFYKPNN